jgi:uncharacterized protein (TIGR02217 family)
MSFIDEYMPEEVPGYPCISAPRWNTSIQVNAGGNERRNQNWSHPLHNFIIPEAVARETDVVLGLKSHWLIMKGPFNSFPWQDPMDKASIDHIPNIPDEDLIPLLSETDQLIGTADGFTDTFQLVRTYSVGSETYDRNIYLPVVSTVLVSMDGTLIEDTEYTVTRPGGEVVFNVPPTPEVGADGIIKAGFMFDVEVRFENDDAFESILRTWQAAGFADLTLVEVRRC